MTNRAFRDASPLWQLARGCEWALSGFFSCSFLPPLLQQQNPFLGAFLGKVFSLSSCPSRPCPSGMLKGRVPCSMFQLYQRIQRMPILRVLHSGTVSNHRDSRMRPDALSSGHCALAERGQWDFSGSKSWTGMQQKADACWNNSSSSSLVYFV